MSYKYGIHINENMDIGPGLNVVHGNGVYINCKSIGKNFTVYQNVTLGGSGADKSSPRHGLPIVEDDVTVFTGAVIAGNITLHKGCVIGANAYVNKDVPAYTLVAGVPAKVIRRLDEKLE